MTSSSGVGVSVSAKHAQRSAPDLVKMSPMLIFGPRNISLADMLKRSLTARPIQRYLFQGDLLAYASFIPFVLSPRKAMSRSVLPRVRPPQPGSEPGHKEDSKRIIIDFEGQRLKALPECGATQSANPSASSSS
jgi:hypothetical protein